MTGEWLGFGTPAPQFTGMMRALDRVCKREPYWAEHRRNAHSCVFCGVPLLTGFAYHIHSQRTDSHYRACADCAQVCLAESIVDEASG